MKYALSKGKFAGFCSQFTRIPSLNYNLKTSKVYDPNWQLARFLPEKGETQNKNTYFLFYLMSVLIVLDRDK